MSTIWPHWLQPSPGPVQPPALGGMSVCLVSLKKETECTLPSKPALLSVLYHLDGPNEGRACRWPELSGL